MAPHLQPPVWPVVGSSVICPSPVCQGSVSYLTIIAYLRGESGLDSLSGLAATGKETGFVGRLNVRCLSSGPAGSQMQPIHASRSSRCMIFEMLWSTSGQPLNAVLSTPNVVDAR